MSKPVFIYTLSDPRSPTEARYVGQSRNLRLRLWAHASRDPGSRKHEWIKSLLKVGLVPCVQVVETVTAIDAATAERRWIAYYSRCDLFNLDQRNNGIFTAQPFSKMLSKLSLDDVQRRYIASILKQCNGNKQTSARILRIGRQTLYNKIKAYNLGNSCR